MKILWVNSSTTRTMSNTRLFGMPPIFNRWGHPTSCLIGGRRPVDLPEYFMTLPVPFNKLGLYRILVTLFLPYFCLKYKFDLVITDWMSAKLARLVVVLRYCGLLRCKLIHDVRTVPVKDDQGKGYGVFTRALKFAARHFDGVTTITSPLRDQLCGEFGFSEEQIGVWTSGVDVEHFKYRPNNHIREVLNLSDNFIVFYHGAINENRGVIELAKAAAYLRDLPDLRIIIVGKGNQWPLLVRTVEEQNLSNVILQEGVPYSDIPRWISAADICVVPLPDHPWWRVSSPLKLMEYLAVGKPVLLTDMIAHRAIIPDDTSAFYIPSAEPEEFAKGLKRAITEQHRFSELGAWGRAKAEAELTWEGQAKRLRDYIEKVISDKVIL